MPASDVGQFLGVSLLFFSVFGGDVRQEYIRMIRVITDGAGDYSTTVPGSVFANDDRPSVELPVTHLTYAVGYFNRFIHWRYAKPINRNTGFSDSLQEYVMWDSSVSAPRGSA